MTSLDLAWAVRSVDSLLRQRQGIAEISDDKDCVIRIAIAPARRTIELSDGTTIAAGDPMIRMHYWNEHLPMMPPDGPNAAWAAVLLTRLRHSFGILADRLESDPDLAEVRGIEAAPAFAYGFRGAIQLSRICERFGFDVFALENDRRLAGRVHDVLDGFLVWGLIWAFNPGALRGHGLSHRRIQVLMSRRRLLSLYGDGPVRDMAGREALLNQAERI